MPTISPTKQRADKEGIITPTSISNKQESEDESVSEYHASDAESSSSDSSLSEASTNSSPAPSPKKSTSNKKKKSYPCNHPGCGRTFTTSGHLSRHRRIHSGVKNYRCPLVPCSASFFRSDNMMTHFKVHARRLGINTEVDAQILVAASTGIWSQELMSKITPEMEQEAKDAGIVIGSRPPTPIEETKLPSSPKRKRSPKKLKTLELSSDEEIVTTPKKRGRPRLPLESPTKTLREKTLGLTLDTTHQTTLYDKAVKNLAETLEMVFRGALESGLSIIGVESMTENYLSNLAQKINHPIDSPVTPSSALMKVKLSDGQTLEVLGPKADSQGDAHVFIKMLQDGQEGKELADKIIQDALAFTMISQDQVHPTLPVLHVEEPSLGLFSTSSMDLLGSHAFSTSTTNLGVSEPLFLTSATTPVTGSKDESNHLNVLGDEEWKDTLPPLPPQEGEFDMLVLDESPI